MEITDTRERTRWTLGSRLRRTGALVLALGAALALVASATAAPALTWTTPAAVTAGLDGVSCPSFGVCVATAGTAARINTSPTSSTTWNAASTGATNTLLAVSCAGETTVCVAVGDAGQITATANAQAGASSSWSATTSPDSAHDLTSVSCPSTAFCLAVDNHGNAVYSTSPSSGPLDARHRDRRDDRPQLRVVREQRALRGRRTRAETSSSAPLRPADRGRRPTPA